MSFFKPTGCSNCNIILAVIESSVIAFQNVLLNWEMTTTKCLLFTDTKFRLNTKYLFTNIKIKLVIWISIDGKHKAASITTNKKQHDRLEVCAEWNVEQVLLFHGLYTFWGFISLPFFLIHPLGQLLQRTFL